MKQQRLSMLSLAVFVSACAYHLSLIWRFAVDVPYRDEWQLVSMQLAKPFSFSWLIEQHNEHRIATTKLVVWILYQWTAWDLRIHLMFNFVVFLLMLGSLLLLMRECLPKAPLWLALLFLTCMLSTLNWENHTWGFQLQFHFFLLFLIWSARCLFDDNEQNSSKVFGLLAFILMVFSFSAGAAAGMALVLLYGIRSFLRGNIFSIKSGLPLLICIIVIGAWFAGYQRLSWQPDLVLPTDERFWAFFVNLSSLGFGFETYSVALGLWCFLLVFLPGAALLMRHWREGLPVPWQALALASGIAAALASVAMGRAGHEAIEIWSKGSRYVEIACFVVPLSFVFSYSLYEERKLLRWLACWSIGLTAAVGYADDFETETYAWIASQKRAGISCLGKHLKSGEPNKCPEIWGEDVHGALKTSKKLKLSFLQNIL